MKRARGGGKYGRAKQALKRRPGVQQLRRILNQAVGRPNRNIPYPAQLRGGHNEVKAIDIPLTTTNFASPGTPPLWILLNGSNTGAGYFNRIGSKFLNKSLHVRGWVKNIATTNQDFGRIVVIYDRQTNGTAPAFTDVIQIRDNVGNPTNPGTGELNLDNRDRFVILRDLEILLPSCTNTAGVLTNFAPMNTVESGSNGNELRVNMYIKMPGYETMCKGDASTGAVGDIKSGGIFICFFTSAVSNTWQANWNSRLRFSDN